MTRLIMLLLTMGLQGTPVQNGDMVEGVDVSHYQGEIDWSKVEADGISFAFVKATQGTREVDRRFKAHWAALKKSGMSRGAYHFLVPDEDGTAQAKHFLATVNFQKGDLLPVVDVEKKGHDLPGVLMSFLAEVKRQLGVDAVIYTAPAFWNEHLAPTLKAPLENPLWIAEYGVRTPKVADKIGPWVVWQYTNQGRVAGISGPVDRDRARITAGKHRLQEDPQSPKSGPRG